MRHVTSAAEPRVWLVVLTWNGRTDTLALLASLAEHVVPHHEHLTVLVVDNGSADQTLEAVTTEHPWAAQIQTGRNLGYAGGNNAGIAEALAGGADVIAVLNNDTQVNGNFLAPLLAALDTDPPAVVSPDIRYFHDPGTSWFRGGTVDGWNFRHLQVGEWPVGSFETDWLSGCCLVATAETWRTVGLFNPWLFLTFEDVDWSMRARAAGVRLIVVPDAVLEHRVSSTINAMASTAATFYWSRNGIAITRRYLGRRLAMEFAFHEVVRPALRDLAKGNRLQRSRALTALRGTLAGVTAWRSSRCLPRGRTQRRLRAGQARCPDQPG